jgi:hypothetical protein
MTDAPSKNRRFERPICPLSSGHDLHGVLKEEVEEQVEPRLLHRAWLGDTPARRPARLRAHRRPGSMASVRLVSLRPSPFATPSDASTNPARNLADVAVHGDVAVRGDTDQPMIDDQQSPRSHSPQPPGALATTSADVRACMSPMACSRDAARGTAVDSCCSSWVTIATPCMARVLMACRPSRWFSTPSVLASV